MLTVDGYVRVSTEEQALDGVSLSAQTTRIDGYINLYGCSQGIALRRVVVDAGHSAKTLQRPGMQGLLADLRAGAIGGVVVAKLDRLTRSLADWSHLIDRYFGDRAGKQLMSVDDKIDTTSANGRLALNVLMTVSQWEREVIAERTRTALRHKIARGERVGKVRFGYALARDGRTLVEHPGEQHAIALMAVARRDGHSLRRVCAILERANLPTRDGAPWHPSTVQKILNRTA